MAALISDEKFTGGSSKLLLAKLPAVIALSIDFNFTVCLKFTDIAIANRGSHTSFNNANLIALKPISEPIDYHDDDKPLGAKTNISGDPV